VLRCHRLVLQEEAAAVQVQGDGRRQVVPVEMAAADDVLVDARSAIQRAMAQAAMSMFCTFMLRRPAV
jgi:hypothetical protein